MAIIKPFAAIRPGDGLAEHIAALPYDVYDREEAGREVAREPLSFLRIDRAETQFDGQTDMYDECVYQKARQLLWDMVSQGQLVREEKPCYYIYELTMDGRSQTGIAACASVDDYLCNVIKKHENTRADKEEDRIRHVDVCGAQTGPIFLAYRSDETINALVDEIKKTAPLYDFVSPDKVAHRVWRINNTGQMEEIKKAFEKKSEIYIADGHHRCVSAVKVALKRRREHPAYTGEEEFNFFLSVLFPDDQLMILDYNRVVKDLNSYTEEEFLARISEDFIVEKKGGAVYKPEAKGMISMYLKDGWYCLREKKPSETGDPVERLDVSVLQNKLLEPVLGICDPKTDKRIDFVGGIRGTGELERRVREDCRVAFAMYPTSIQELFTVSDAGLLMPPKSTWFEPKLRSGLFIHEI